MASGDEPRDYLIVPSVSEAVRDTMVADIGTIIYNTTTNKLNVCKAKVAHATSWEAITSA
jgi:hypothetical protein